MRSSGKQVRGRRTANLAFGSAAATLLWLTASCGPSHQMRPTDGGPSAGGAITSVPPLDSPAGCGAFDVASLKACVARDRIERDVKLIARARPPGSPHHKQTRELCQQRLAAYGYEVVLHGYGSGVNVLGTKLGFSKPAERVIVSAHYDHIAGCQGADDNASGLAAVLETARILADARFDRSLVIACWDEGEREQLGSKAYAQAARAGDAEIVAAMSYEAVAYTDAAQDSQQIPEGFEKLFPDQAIALLERDYRADFLTVVSGRASGPWAEAVVRHGGLDSLEVYALTLTARQKQKQRKLHRSDHMSFWDAKYPALLLTDTAGFRNPRAHCQASQDAPDTLDFDFAARVTRAGLGAVVEMLQLR